MKKEQENFNPHEFINSMIREMGMENEPSEKLEELTRNIEFQMADIMMNTASQSVEPEVLDYISAKEKDETDPLRFFTKIIEASPQAQYDILEAFDKFREQTIKTFKFFKKS
jgi:hypothetical protein